MESFNLRCNCKNASPRGGTSRYAMQGQVSRTECGCSPWCYAKGCYPEMFNKEAGNHVEDRLLRFAYVSPPKPSSPVPEESRKGLHLGLLNPKMDILKVSGEHVEVRDNSTEARALFLKLNKEKNNAAQQNNELRQELELLKRGSAKGSSGSSGTSSVCCAYWLWYYRGGLGDAAERV